VIVCLFLSGMRKRVDVLTKAIIPKTASNYDRMTYGGIVPGPDLLAKKRTSAIGSDSDPFLDKTTTSCDENEDKKFDYGIGQIQRVDVAVEDLEDQGYNDAEIEEIKEKEALEFTRGAREEERLEFEAKQRLRRHLIQIKMKKLEKLQQEEAEKQADRNKTITSLTPASALEHVVKIGNSDPYRLFLLPPPLKDKKWSVTENDIRKRVRRLQLLVHPDKHKGHSVRYQKAQDAFKIVREAEATLRDALENSVKVEAEEEDAMRKKRRLDLVEDLERRVNTYNAERQRKEQKYTFVTADGAVEFGPDGEKVLDVSKRPKLQEEMERVRKEDQWSAYMPEEQAEGKGKGYWAWKPMEEEEEEEEEDAYDAADAADDAHASAQNNLGNDFNHMATTTDFNKNGNRDKKEGGEEEEEEENGQWVWVEGTPPPEMPQFGDDDGIGTGWAEAGGESGRAGQVAASHRTGDEEDDGVDVLDDVPDEGARGGLGGAQSARSAPGEDAGGLWSDGHLSFQRVARK